MKIFFILLCVSFLSIQPAFASKNPANKYFDTLTIALEHNYALNDTLEFSVFDLSDMKVLNDCSDLKDLIVAPITETETPAIKEPEKKTTSASSAEEEAPADLQVAPIFKEFARYFYVNLKKQIVEQQAPVSLATTSLPNYAKPLSLSIKINQVHFKAFQADKKGYKFLPVVVNISGEIKDKLSDELLFSFVDSVETMLPTDASKPEDVLNQAAVLLMKDFALFLKSQY